MTYSALSPTFAYIHGALFGTKQLRHVLYISRINGQSLLLDSVDRVLLQIGY